ncbi:MAG: TIR domain-containing protein, partial [Promethearchaeota archaeon]
GVEINSNGVLLYYNNFTGNIDYHAIDDGINNIWDNGVIGNYWDNYTGGDANDDGIGDIPYNITGLAKSKDNFPIWEDGDQVAPIISIISPNEYQIFQYNAPFYNITIFESYELDSIWYTIDNGITNYTISNLTGFINQTAWDGANKGAVMIVFYANDTSGHIGNNSVSIGKFNLYWQLNPLRIDDIGKGNYTWAQAITQGWCSGSGIKNDPYIIEFIRIDGKNSRSCITVSNSDVYFVIRNCTFYNSGANSYDGGLNLYSITNGELKYLNCSSNNGNGILLNSCHYINISGSTIKNNKLDGIKLVDCTYIYILNNNETISLNGEYGIHLFRSHYNVIFNNTIDYNSVGIYLDQSNFNSIDFNKLSYNGQAIINNGQNNDIGDNNKIISRQEEIPFDLILIILLIIISIVGVISTAIILKKRVFVSGKIKKEIDEKKRKKLRNKLTKKLKFVDYLIEENNINLAYKKLGKVKDTADQYDFFDIFNQANKKVETCKEREAGIYAKLEKVGIAEERESEKKPMVTQVIKEKVKKEKTQKHKVFLSYSTLDSEYFQIPRVVKLLGNYPKIDKVLYWEADSARNIVDYMEDTLKSSNIFILFCSENSAKSSAVKDEWQAAFQLRKKKLIKLIPVYEKEEHIPVLLMPLLSVKYSKEGFQEFIQKLYEEILRKEF